MKTKNLFFMVGLFCIGIIFKSSGQNNVVSTTSVSAPGQTNVIVGVNAGANSSTSPIFNFSNVFVGFNSGLNTAQGLNTFVGFQAGRDNTGGDYNTFIGAESGRSNTTGRLNTFIGARNTGFANTTGQANVFIGSESAQENLSGSGNTFVGGGSGRYNVSGNFNAFFGAQAGDNNKTGNNNISIGSRGPTNGTNNILMGALAGANCSGFQNLMLGFNSGQNATTGNYNTFLGYVQLPTTAKTATFNGFDASAMVILADGGGTQRLVINSNGYTGIGLGSNNLAQNMLELNGGIAGTSGLRFRSYTSASTPVASNGRVLTLNASGDVVLTTDVGSGGTTVIANGTNTTVTGTGVTATPYQINAKNIYTDDGTITSGTGVRTVTMGNNNLFFNTSLSHFENGTSGSGRVYIGNSTSFPLLNSVGPNISQYRLLVEGGVLTEKVKIALRSSADWADYVFANDFKLMPLKEVETYINVNKHLPGVASAEELVKGGLDVAEIQATQMGKIEELTLYLIKQNKTIEQQGKEIEELKTMVKTLLEKK